jgi:hypothetical protein
MVTSIRKFPRADCRELISALNRCVPGGQQQSAPGRDRRFHVLLSRERTSPIKHHQYIRLVIASQLRASEVPKMTTCPPERKRIRMDGADNLKKANDDDWGLLDLPMLQIVQYLDHNERLSLAATCKQAVDHVELYCKLVLQVIVGPNNCNTDASFQERIRDTSPHKTNRNLLPFRLLVERAKKTHLTAFATSNGNPRPRGIELSPSEARIATASGSAIRVFDLATNTCVASLDVEAAKVTLGLNGYRLSYCRFHGEDKILFCSDDTICLWNLTLSTEEEGCSLLISHRTIGPCGFVKDVISISDDEIILVEEDGVYLHGDEYPIWYEYGVRCLDTQSESSKLLLTLREKNDRNVRLFCTVGGKKWLAIWNSFSNELSLYNLGTMEQTATWKGYLGGQFASIPISRTACTLCFLDGGSYHDLNVFNLDESTGTLSFSRSFKVHSPKYNSGTTHILALTESQVLIEEDYGAGGSYTRAFNLNPRSFRKAYGEMIALPTRNLSLSSPLQAVVSTAGNKIYVQCFGGAIEVFLRSEPTGILV